MYVDFYDFMTTNSTEHHACFCRRNWLHHCPPPSANTTIIDTSLLPVLVLLSVPDLDPNVLGLPDPDPDS